jgi:hypothetical protein
MEVIVRVVPGVSKNRDVSISMGQAVKPALTHVIHNGYGL